MAIHDLNEFKETLGDGIRGNKFKMIISLPNGVSGDSRTLSLMIKSFTLPANATGTIDVNKSGRMFQLAGDGQLESPLSIVALLNSSGSAGEAKKIADDWQKATVTKTYSDYVGSAMVEVYKPNGIDIVLKYKITDLWMLNSGEIELDNDATNALLTLPMTFSASSVEVV